MNDMKPVKEGWPLWVWLKGVRATSSAPSKIERLLSGGTSNLLGRGADNLTEFIYRYLRRYPNTILAADSDAFYGQLVRRYRTNRSTVTALLPSQVNSIGYLVASESELFRVSATAWANVQVRYSDEEACKRILNAAKNRNRELAKKKNLELSGEARESVILMAELSGGLRK